MILERSDYIAIQYKELYYSDWGNTIKFYSPNRYTSINLKQLVSIFSSLTPNKDLGMIEFIEWTSNRFCIRSTTNPQDTTNITYRVVDMSYRMKILTGFYHETFPIYPLTIYKIIGGERNLWNLELSRNDDYIVVNEILYDIRIFDLPTLWLDTDDENGYLSLSIMREVFKNTDFEFQFIDGNLEIFNRVQLFVINFISDGFARLTGFKATNNTTRLNIVVAPSAGYYQLTPVLYLTSNIGETCFCYNVSDRDKKFENYNKKKKPEDPEYVDDGDCTNQKILMRINNQFTSGYPIIAHNFEFSSRILSSALSDVTFKLVDANFQPVTLLNPMYLSAIATPVEERQIDIEFEK
jgi:hypothetical protein